MSIDLRSISTDEIAAFRTEMSVGFGNSYNADGTERFKSLMPLDRTVAAFDGDELVGTLGDFPLQLTLPGGGQLDMAGTTMVTVRPTHTRRGILRSMMRSHLDNAVERGEAIAGLWASEPGIYGRFGFGHATDCHDVTIDSRHVDPLIVAPDLTLRLIAGDQLQKLVAPFWNRIANQRPGFIDRNDARWQDLANDPDWTRGGASSARHVVVERDGQVVGYLAYRQRENWENFTANGSVVVNALVGEDLDAHLALWAFALDVDLFPNVNYWDGAIDDPLVEVVSNARAVRRTSVDGLYVRILDISAALVARKYECDGEVVFKLTDDMGYADGTYRLTVVNGRGTVTASTVSDPVELGVRELGAMYLGRHCTDLHATLGDISGPGAAVQRLGQLFATARAPWCPEMF